MSDISIKSREDLEAWLDTRPQTDAITISNRAALRILPNIAEIFTTGVENPRKSIILPVWRAMFASSVARWGIATDEAKLSAARSAAASAVATADSATFSAASAATADSAAWALIEDEAKLLIDADDVSVLAVRSLWPQGQPDWARENWEQLRSALLSTEAKDEDWGVWIDWYEAQLAGVDKASINHALEEAILLIPDEKWEAGPKVANAEIRRLMQVHSREALDTNLSPEPVIANGQITVAANATADVPDDLANILALPERLGEAIDTLLDMLAIKVNACPVIVPPLRRYRKHLDEYGPRPMLDRLNDLHQIVRDEYLGLHRERFFDGERGLRRALLIFFDLHKKFRSEFAKDAIREQAIRTYRLDREGLDSAGLIENIDAFEQGAQAAEEAGVATPEFLDYATELSEAMRHALKTPLPGPSVEVVPDDPLTDAIPNEKLWPVRWLMKGGAFAGRLFKLLNNSAGFVGSVASIIGFLDSPRGEKFMQALKQMRDAIFGDADGEGDS